MPQFFIDRPVFAWVLAILITLGGLLALTRLPAEAYPQIAPPQVSVSATYPGASAATVETTVTQIIEQQLTGLDHLLYFTSQSASDGSAAITLTFENGTNADIAAVQTQNRVTLAAAAPAGGSEPAGHPHRQGERRIPRRHRPAFGSRRAERRRS